MALSPSEKQRRYRERLKAKRLDERAKPRPEPVFEQGAENSFAHYLRDRAILFPETLDWVGVHIAGDLEQDVHPIGRANEWEEQAIPLNSLTRASAMVDAFVDAAKELSELINAYKLAEIDRQLRTARTTARQELLFSLKTRLSKRTSHFFPAI